MTAQHPQLVSTVVFAERLKCLRLKSSSKQVASACEWITGELRRRAAAALHDATLNNARWPLSTGKRALKKYPRLRQQELSSPSPLIQFGKITDKAEAFDPSLKKFRMVSVPKLIERTAGRKPQRIHIDKIWGGTRESPGFSEDRLKATDTKHPILVDSYYEGDGKKVGLVDGRHRKLKLMAKGQKTARIIKITQEDIDHAALSSPSPLIQLASAAWQRKEGKSASGGLNRKGVASYRRENPGNAALQARPELQGHQAPQVFLRPGLPAPALAEIR